MKKSKDYLLIVKIVIKLVVAVAAFYILGNTLVLYQGF